MTNVARLSWHDNYFISNLCKRLHRFLLAILMLLYCATSFAQEKSISGRVISDQGQPLVGVTVDVEGKQVATSTNDNGEFTITIQKDDLVKFSLVGYEPGEVIIDQQTSLIVTLKESATNVDEVVVVGYGTQRKEAVTGSVASISGTEMNEVPAANITRALQGRIAGVEMSQSSSKPGSTMQIRIRGVRSLTASNDPLVVLDGVPFAGSLSDINPNNIKSVDILKDASATAIYGSRGANGVILVTTNTGVRDQPARAYYNGFHGLRDVFAKYPMMSGPEFSTLRQYVGQFGNTLDESYDVDTDWQDLYYRTGMITSHDAGVSGGSETGSYNFGAGYFRDESVIPLQNYSRFTFRGSLDQQVGEYFKFGFNLNNNYNISNGMELNASSVLGQSPIANPFNEDGSLKTYIQQQTSGQQFVVTREVLEGLGDRYANQTRALSSYNTMFGELQIPGVEGLKYRLNLGLNFRQSNDGNYTGEGIFSGTPDNPSTASVGNGRTFHWVAENIATYDRTFSDVHQFNFTGLFSAERNNFNSTYISARGIPLDAFQFYNIGRAEGEIIVDPNNQVYQESSLMSWMGRVMYTYDNKYMLTATLRSDGSSRLAPRLRWHTYPAVSAGWNIHSEDFMSGINWINQAKLRVGYGQTSNQAVDPYKTLGLLTARPYNFGNDFSTGIFVSELPNSSLGWEFSETYNYGLDFGLFNNRLSGTVEYYVQKTNNLLLSVGLPPTTGVTSYMANVGKTQNKGLELSLNGVILDNLEGWSWEGGVNFYLNRNKLVELSSGQTRDEGNQWFVGYPIDVIFDYERIGLWQEGDPYLDILEPGGNVGMIKVKYTGEYDADGVPVRQIGPDDRQVLNVQPNFQGGFNTRVSYKNIDLGIIGAFKNGGTLISSLYGSSGYLNTLNARAGNNVSVDYWTEDNTDAKYPKPGGIQSSDNPKYGSTLGYFDASYMKIRTITLGFQFGENWLKKFGVNNMRVYGTVENPFVFFSPYHRESNGGDPEPNSFGDENVAVGGLRRMLIVGTNTPTTKKLYGWTKYFLLIMKKMSNTVFRTIATVVLISFCIFFTNCSNFLDEKPRGIYIPEDFKTYDGINGGITSLYAHLRYIYGQAYYYNATQTGTDEMTWGQSADANFRDMDFSGVGNLTAESSRADVLWETAFPNINTASGIIENAVEVSEVPESLIAEAYFFRAFDYFMLVQTFGGVPLDLGSGELKFNVNPVRTASRNTVSDVYTKAVFPDLIKAVEDLPETPRLTGALTKTVAKLYLAKAYLTYAWWLENPKNIPTYPETNRTDPDGQTSTWYFQRAYDIATEAIDNPGPYALQETFYDVNVGTNDRNSELLLYADHTEDSELFNGGSLSYGSGSGPDNFAGWMVTWNYQSITSSKTEWSAAELVSSVQREAIQALGRPWVRMAPPIEVFTETFADKTNDSRYDGTFVTSYRGNWNKGGVTNEFLYNANNMKVYPGDAIFSFLDEEPDTEIDYSNSVFKSSIGAGVLPGRADFVISPKGISRRIYPGLWKLGPYRTDNGTGLGQPNAGSTRPYNIAKFSEFYLLAAEAAVKGASTVSGKSARDLINVIRARAGVWQWDNNGNVEKIEDRSVAMISSTPTTITIEYLLAERSREYFGEGYRWYDLVRTQTWDEIAKSYTIAGSDVGDHNAQTFSRDIQPYHYLRPIPQSQLDAMELAAEERDNFQNPGYN